MNPHWKVGPYNHRMFTSAENKREQLKIVIKLSYLYRYNNEGVVYQCIKYKVCEHSYKDLVLKAT